MSLRRSMRASICERLGAWAKSEPRLMAVSADGQLIFRDFIAVAPERHVDVGISEASLVGVAAGLARSGRPVVISSIAAFLVRRAYEQIALDIALDALPVTMIGIGGGLAYGVLGATHHVTEDCGLMSLNPAISVFAPADAPGAEEALDAALACGGPAYIRIGSAEDLVIGGSPLSPCTRPRIRHSGEQATILTYGACLGEALLAAEVLDTEGLSVRVVEVVQLKPLDIADLAASIAPGGPVLVVEEHITGAGLATPARQAAAMATASAFAVLAVDGRYPPVGDREHLLSFYGLDTRAIIEEMRRLNRHN